MIAQKSSHPKFHPFPKENPYSVYAFNVVSELYRKWHWGRQTWRKRCFLWPRQDSLSLISNQNQLTKLFLKTFGDQNFTRPPDYINQCLIKPLESLHYIQTEFSCCDLISSHPVQHWSEEQILLLFFKWFIHVKIAIISLFSHTF